MCNAIWIHLFQCLNLVINKHVWMSGESVVVQELSSALCKQAWAAVVQKWSICLYSQTQVCIFESAICCSHPGIIQCPVWMSMNCSCHCQHWNKWRIMNIELLFNDYIFQNKCQKCNEKTQWIFFFFKKPSFCWLLQFCFLWTAGIIQ